MLTQRTVWIVCVWFSVVVFHGVAIHVMDADRIDDLVDIIAAVVAYSLAGARWPHGLNTFERP